MHIKLKGSPVICLIGFMGCGKTTVGRLLGERLGWTFVDLDDEIERRAGVPILEIFEHEGEPRFRDIEHEALREQLTLAHKGQARVLALGGGAFVEPRNRDRLELGGLSIWLDCPLETLWERVSSFATRPLARDRRQFEHLYQERLPLYGLADFTIPGDRSPEQIVDTILKLPLF
jgi:shikimate kinase